MDSVESKEELCTKLEEHSRLLVCFWKKACPGCMMVSKLIPLLENDGLPLLGFDCSDGMGEARELGVSGTPQWVLYENGAEAARIMPSADRDALYAFLTERAGFSILRPLFDLALDEGKAYASRMQDAIAEIMFRSRDDGNDILAAARLKTLKACVETPADGQEECVDAQMARCVERLRERLAQPGGETKARLEALESLPSLRDTLLRELAQHAR